MIAFGGIGGKVVLYCQLASENTAFVGGAEGPIDVCLDVCDVSFIDDHTHTLVAIIIPSGLFLQHSWTCLAIIMTTFGFILLLV